MKFIVYRTSDWKGTNIQPCDEAVLENKEEELRENEIYFWATWKALKPCAHFATSMVT